MYGVSAASLARQESAFLWPGPALSALPPLFPPRLCVSVSLGMQGEEKEEKKEERRETRGGEERCDKTRGNTVCLTGWCFSILCVCEVEVLDICDIVVLFATFICCLIYMRFYIQHEIKGAFLWCSLTHDEQKESKQLIIISRFMVLLSQTLMHD